ncbi:hypothetical protein ACFX2J_012367 [Malus domestica]
MAPQVTVYFHELPAVESKLGCGRRASRRIIFTINQAPTNCSMVKTKVATKTCKVAVKKIAREHLLKDIEIVSRELLRAVSSKDTMVPQRKIVKVTSSPPIKVPVITQIMIETIPITLHTTELVMMTFVEEDGEILPIVSENVQQKAKAYELVEEDDNIQFEGPIMRTRARALTVHSPESSSSIGDTSGGNKSFSQEEIPRVMTRFQRLEINESIESKNMQVLMTGASNTEEQLLEM